MIMFVQHLSVYVSIAKNLTKNLLVLLKKNEINESQIYLPKSPFFIYIFILKIK